MKLFLLLANLSKEELKVLRKAVLSPLYNSNKKVVELFELLRPKHPTFDSSNKAKEKLFKKLYPTEEFNDYKWRRVCMELTKVIEQVMIHIDTTANDFARQKQLKSIFNKRGLYPLFKKHTLDLLSQLEVQPIRNAEYHRDKMDLLTEQYFHHKHDKYDFEDETLEQAMEELDIYFALQKMRLAIAFKGREQVLNESTPILFLETIKEEWEEDFLPKNTLFGLYIQAIGFSEETSLEEFERYEQNLFIKIKQFDKYDQRILFTAGLNFVIKKKNKGLEKFKSYPFNWYQFGLSNHLLFEQNKLTETSFANIIIFGCQEKQFDWVENFIETYKIYLNIENISDTLLYYKGVVFYLKGEWDRALDNLTISSKNSIYPLRSRDILIRSFFEKFLIDNSYLELLLSNIQSFETYLRRDNLFAEEKVNQYLSFLKILKSLAKKIHAKESNKSIKKWFDGKLISNKSILARAWLIQKVSTL